MSANSTTAGQGRFRLYILGELSTSGGKAGDLTTLAEFQGQREIERFTLSQQNVNRLLKLIDRLHIFLLQGQGSFNDDSLRNLGSAFYGLIVRGEVARLLSDAGAAASAFRIDLPLEIVLEDRTLASLPWEYLYHPTKKIFLCQSFYPISRGILHALPSAELRPLSPTEPVRILLAFGASQGSGQADPNAQESKLRAVFKGLIRSRRVTLDIMRANPNQVQEMNKKIAKKKYHIFHFFGHAGFDSDKGSNGEGYLLFDQGGGEPVRYYAAQLGNRLRGGEFRLAFLNACETGVANSATDPARGALAQTLLANGVPAVVATQFLMPENSAHGFAESVYDALAAGHSIVYAMGEGRRAMDFSTVALHPDWGIPVLYSKDPGMVLFPGKSRRLAKA
jgi:hypothetical protein